MTRGDSCRPARGTRSGRGDDAPDRRTGQELTTAEAVVASALQPRLGSLPLGTRLRLMLEQVIVDHTGRRLPGPHIAGTVERPTPSNLRIRLFDTEAGRTARALLEEELLDVVLSHGRPPIIRLM